MLQVKILEAKLEGKDEKVYDLEIANLEKLAQKYKDSGEKLKELNVLLEIRNLREKRYTDILEDVLDGFKVKKEYEKGFNSQIELLNNNFIIGRITVEQYTKSIEILKKAYENMGKTVTTPKVPTPEQEQLQKFSGMVGRLTGKTSPDVATFDKETGEYKIDDMKAFEAVTATSLSVIDSLHQMQFEAEMRRIKELQEAKLNALDEETEAKKDNLKKTILTDKQRQLQEKKIDRDAKAQREKIQEETEIALAKSKKKEALYQADIDYFRGLISAGATAYGHGAAGIPEFALVSGLLTSLYLMNRAKIEKQEFFEGGEYSQDGGYSGNVNINSQASGVGKKPYIYHGKEFIFKNKATEGNVTELYRLQDVLSTGVPLKNIISSNNLFNVTNFTPRTSFKEGGLSSPVIVQNNDGSTQMVEMMSAMVNSMNAMSNQLAQISAMTGIPITDKKVYLMSKNGKKSFI